MSQPPPQAPLSPPDFDWEACIRVAREGSPTALGQLLEACRPFLLAVAERELAPDLRAKAAASDLVQETCLDAQRDFPAFEGGTAEEVRAWLRRVLLHNLGDLRQRFRDVGKRDVRREASLDADGSDARQKALALPDDTPSPSSHARRREEETLVEAALAKLSEAHRQVIHLRHRDRRSFAEIGRLMGRSEEAVQKLWERAIQQLRHELRRAP